MPARQRIAPNDVVSALKTIRHSGDRYIPSREIQNVIGCSVRALQRATDALYQARKIERRWIVSQWWYRLT